MSMRVYLKYEEGKDEALHMSIKLKLPKKWIPGPVSNLKETFVEAYNKKHGDTNCVVLEETHLENAKGVALHDDDVVEKLIENRDDILLKHGPAPVRIIEIKEVIDENMLRCKNYGCSKYYRAEDNRDGSCSHHTGPPVFHDTKKGWTCCKDTMAYDWEGFEKIEGCATGVHSTVSPGVTIAPSPTAVLAMATTVQPESKVVTMKSIDEFNTSNPDAITAATSIKKTMTTKPKIEKRTDGKAKCINKGCQQLYVVNENTDTSCDYHSGNPVFHDLKKSWSCCEKVAYDFDAFLAIKGCQNGPHNDGTEDE